MSLLTNSLSDASRDSAALLNMGAMPSTVDHDCRALFFAEQFTKLPPMNTSFGIRQTSLERPFRRYEFEAIRVENGLLRWLWRFDSGEFECVGKQSEVLAEILSQCFQGCVCDVQDDQAEERFHLKVDVD